MNVNRLVVSGLPQEPDDPLRLAQRIGADKVRPFRELRDGLEQARDLVARIGKVEHGNTERRLGYKHIARYGLERRASRVAAALVVTGDDDRHPLRTHHSLRGAQNMACGDQRDLDTIALDRLPISHGFRGTSEILAVARGHDRQSFARCDNRTMTRACMIGMAVRDDRTLDRTHGINIKIPRRAIKPGWRRAQNIFRL